MLRTHNFKESVMSTIDFIRGQLRNLHGQYDEAIKDLTDDQFLWRANDKGHPISFILWHYVRTEDNIINYVLQGKPTIWLEGGWNEKFGLHKAAQGTGMTLEEAQNLKITPKNDWQAYQSAVWAATDAFLDSANEATMQERVTVKPLGEMPRETAIGQVCLTHGFTHLGEIQHLRGLQGLKGMMV
jgi:hypothetical protein